MVIQKLPSVTSTIYFSHRTDKVNTQALLICLLGPFRLLDAQQSQLCYGSEKIETLLSHLALYNDTAVPREQLLTLLWPESDPMLASQSLNTLVYSIRRALKDELEGASPVVQVNGYYGLNYEAGVNVDMMQFERFIDEGERHAQAGQQKLAIAAYQHAIGLYRGDLCVGTDPQALIERERLRARYLTLLMRLADYHYGHQSYTESLAYVQRLLAHDPCREDAHRLAMYCYVRLGERAQAFRQYSLCQTLLQAEFGADPEPATVALHNQIRLDPVNV